MLPKNPKLKGIPPTAQAVIQGLQPYQQGNDFESHPLWALQELSNVDKHRTLLVGTLNNVATALLPDRSFNFRFIGDVIQVYGTLLKPEAVIIRYNAVPINPSQKMRVEFSPMLNIVFECGSSVDGKNTLEILSDIADFIELQVIPQLSKFL